MPFIKSDYPAIAAIFEALDNEHNEIPSRAFAESLTDEEIAYLAQGPIPLLWKIAGQCHISTLETIIKKLPGTPTFSTFFLRMEEKKDALYYPTSLHYMMEKEQHFPASRFSALLDRLSTESLVLEKKTTIDNKEEEKKEKEIKEGTPIKDLEEKKEESFQSKQEEKPLPLNAIIHLIPNTKKPEQDKSLLNKIIENYPNNDEVLLKVLSMANKEMLAKSCIFSPSTLKIAACHTTSKGFNALLNAIDTPELKKNPSYQTELTNSLFHVASRMNSVVFVPVLFRIQKEYFSHALNTTLNNWPALVLTVTMHQDSSGFIALLTKINDEQLYQFFSTKNKGVNLLQLAMQHQGRPAIEKLFLRFSPFTLINLLGIKPVLEHLLDANESLAPSDRMAIIKRYTEIYNFLHDVPSSLTQRPNDFIEFVSDSFQRTANFEPQMWVNLLKEAVTFCLKINDLKSKNILLGLLANAYLNLNKKTPHPSHDLHITSCLLRMTKQMGFEPDDLKAKQAQFPEIKTWLPEGKETKEPMSPSIHPHSQHWIKVANFSANQYKSDCSANPRLDTERNQKISSVNFFLNMLDSSIPIHEKLLFIHAFLLSSSSKCRDLKKSLESSFKEFCNVEDQKAFNAVNEIENLIKMTHPTLKVNAVAKSMMPLIEKQASPIEFNPILSSILHVEPKTSLGLTIK